MVDLRDFIREIRRRKMETVFDHNITDAEWKNLFGIMDKDYYLSILDKESAYLDIAYLYFHRGNKKMGYKYADRLPPLRRLSLMTMITHP